MSKNNNVNPGQYEVAGRARPGEDIVAADRKARLTQALAATKDRTATKSATKKTAGKPGR